MIQILNVVIRKGKNPHSYGSKQAGYTPGGTCFDPRYFYILGKVTRKNPGDLVKHLLCRPPGQTSTQTHACFEPAFCLQNNHARLMKTSVNPKLRECVISILINFFSVFFCLFVYLSWSILIPFSSS